MTPQTLPDVLQYVIHPAPCASYATTADWKRAHLERARDIERGVDLAIAQGALADRVGWAFASGYTAAVAALVPKLPRDACACLAATEVGGAHPRAIATSLVDSHVRGRKEWITLGRAADYLMVVAKAGEQSGRPLLKMVMVDAGAQGVSFASSSPAPFVPEIEHGAVSLDCIGLVLPGDGYGDYLKPFRTIEDIYVHAAVLAHLVATLVRAAAEPAWVAQGLAVLTGLRALADADPKRAETHLALEGFIRQSASLVADAERVLDRIDGDIALRWRRDRTLLQVARKAREGRFAAASASIGGEPASGAPEGPSR